MQGRDPGKQGLTKMAQALTLNNHLQRERPKRMLWVVVCDFKGEEGNSQGDKQQVFGERRDKGQRGLWSQALKSLYHTCRVLCRDW